MKHFSQLLIVLISVFSLARYAIAESQPPRVEFPNQAKPGVRWSYVDGAFLIKCNRWELKELISSSGLLVSKCGDNTIYVTADNMNPVMAVNDKNEIVAKFSPFYPDLSFPLFVGKKWSGKYTGQEGRFIKWSGDLSCESTSFESVQIAAGKFDAFRIECVDKWDSGIIFINGKMKSTRWYAPSIGLVIKSVNDISKYDYEIAGGDWR